MKKIIIALLLSVLVGCVAPFAPTITQAETNKEYKVVGNYADGDYIISNINVLDYGAVANDGKDDVQAFKDALQAAASQGGGVVYAPAGVYNFSSTFTIPSLVTLCGEWDAPSKKMENQTVLSVDYESNGKTNSTAYFIKLGGSSAVMSLSVYYSKQNASNPIEYPFTIGLGSPLTTVKDITLFNSYNGVVVGTATHTENIYVTAFNIGVENEPNYEISNFVNINVSGDYLNWYDGTKVEDIKSGTTKCKAIVSSKCDDLFIYNVTIDENYYNNVIYLNKVSAADAGGTSEQAYGHIFQAHGATIERKDPNYRLKASYEDEIAGVTKYFHVVQGGRYPAKTQVFDVKSYGAKGDGSDATTAIKSAISAAQTNGGGTVFFPAGEYKVTDKITVPANIELRGAWDSPIHKSGTVITVDYGKGNADDCVFEIGEKSGVHGFSVFCAEMSYQSTEALQNSVYPWIFRIVGDGGWVENITFVNSWNGIDVVGSDKFMVKGIWGTCINQNVNVGGGSSNGVIEYVMCTYGTWWENTLRDPVATEFLISYSYEYNVGLTLGDVTNLAILSFSCFGIRTGLSVVDENGASAENIRIIRFVTDLPEGYNNVEAYAGNNIAIIGLSTGGGVIGSRFIKLYNSFNGKIRIYGQVVWSNGGGMVIYSDKDYANYTPRSEDVDIIDFNFEWEKGYNNSNKKGCGGEVSTETAAFIVFALTSVTLLVCKKRKVKITK